jgi:hypothetical protein
MVRQNRIGKREMPSWTLPADWVLPSDTIGTMIMGKIRLSVLAPYPGWKARVKNHSLAARSMHFSA